MVMPASHARAALPGWRRAGWRRAAAAAVLLLPLTLAPSPAPAQDAPAPRAGAAARPNAGAAGTPGLAPLQTEPGDIWAEVRGWTQGKGSKNGAESARRKPAAAADSAEGPPPKPRRAAPCTAETPGCTRRPARPPANPG
jgi:hypothetical protein